MSSRGEEILTRVREQDPDQDEFHQAVEEALPALLDVLRRQPELDRDGVIERLLEPDRIVRFRVVWEDDEGSVRTQRGWRVQQTSVLGPCKGGLRFHRDLKLGTLRFLSFEQSLKNALTGLPLGAGKGGSDFDPRGKSRSEVMRFCHAFMTELFRHIGPETDVPAGDIGVGSREVDFLIGQYRRLTGRWNGALSGKSSALGGVALRTEATGYGAVRFCERLLEAADRSALDGRRVIVTGAGNVALHAAERLIEKGAKVVALSDSGGVLNSDDGLTRAHLETVKTVKLQERGQLATVSEKVKELRWGDGETPWKTEASLAFLCATQNELDGEGARCLADSGVDAVIEGANMPCTQEAVATLKEAGILRAPGKAANAGGVIMSEAEMAQNASRSTWSRDRSLDHLDSVIDSIHDRCLSALGDEGVGEQLDYERGATAAGFERLARALYAVGAV